MDDIDRIEGYVSELEAALRRAGRPPQPLVDEARAHLFEDAARIARDEGCDDHEAARRAVERFGAVAEIVAASRTHGRRPAAMVARAASVVLLATLASQVYVDLTPYEGAMGWPIMGGGWSFTTPFLLLVGELAVVSWALWRALGRGTAPRWLTTALQLHAALASVLLVASFALGMRQLPGWEHIGIYGVMNFVPPLWLLMGVQSFAALATLRRQQATQVGQPSSPVALQPPG